MRSIRYAYLLFLIAFSHYACAQNPEYSKEIEDIIKKVENNLTGWVKLDGAPGWNLQQRMKFHNVHGVSIAVIKDYKIHWVRGYGWADTSDKRPVTPSTLFQAASISKSLHAMGVLKLADKKIINIHAPVNDYLRTWKLPEDSFTAQTKVTTAHLLSHTGGLSVHGFRGYSWTDSIPSDNDILDGKPPANSAPVRSQFAPGARYQYSGGGTTVSKKVVMDITGQPYDMFMWKEVLEPIGMRQSFYTQPPPPQAFRLLATAYRADGRPIKGKFHIYPEQAADGLWTTPGDIAQFIIEMQLSMQGKSNKVLSQQMTNTMLTPYIDREAALGVFVIERNGGKYFTHNGANEGFRSQYYGSFENGNGVVVMVNSDVSAIVGELINSVAIVYGWKDLYTPQIRKEVKVPTEKLRTYTGEYILPPHSFKITLVNDRLFASQNNQTPIPMYFTTENAFFVMEGPPADFEFVANGHSNLLVIKQGGREYKAVKK